jgi:formylglycine-generating enzyme required for sulfatase activity
MEISFRVRECGFKQSLAYAEDYGINRIHQEVTLSEEVELTAYAMDRYPVTNQDFAQFLKASGYQPKHSHSFLKHWVNGHIPAGLENHPVVYVSLEDARAYAQWIGKRLPSNHEWTYAAKGETTSKFPWGDEAQSKYCNLEKEHTTSVDAHPQGITPFGCYDMIGNTWEWTESEYSDGRTRFCFIKGGSYFNPQGSKWYVLGGPKPSSWAEKFLLMWPGLDRSATIGFRCAMNL